MYHVQNFIICCVCMSQQRCCDRQCDISSHIRHNSSAKWCKAFSAMVEYTLSIVTCILSQKKGDCFWFVELLFCSSKKITQKTTISQRLWRSSVEQHWCMERPQLKCASRSIIFLCLLNAHYGVFLIFFFVYHIYSFSFFQKHNVSICQVYQKLF